MYLNNVSIVCYGLLIVIGFIVGRFISWCNIRLPEKKPVFSGEYYEEKKKGFPYTYVFMLVTAAIYVLLLYKYGIKETFAKNLDLLKFLILTPMLELTFAIDLKHRIIPNRLVMTIFEVGIIFTFWYEVANINILKDLLLGMLTGGGIFLAIALLGGLIAGKEAMGFGDVKFMAAIGLYLGTTLTLETTFLAFILAAVISIIIIIYRKIRKIDDDEIPFGPFLSLAAILCIFLPNNIIFIGFGMFCKAISDCILRAIYG